MRRFTIVEMPDPAQANNRIVRGGMAALLCVIAHGQLLRQMVWTAGQAPMTKDLPARVVVANDQEEASLEWIALDPNSLSELERPKPTLPIVQLQRIDILKKIQELSVVTPDLNIAPTPEATVADAGRLSKMYGRYVEQVAARIERGWRRPRSAIGASSFECQVQIRQSLVGAVEEVTLLRCNGDSLWQQSLVEAIQSASPLPAPPDPDVFSRTVNLAFSAEPYSAQRPAYEYEPEQVALAREAAATEKVAKEALAHVDETSSNKLTIAIIGDRTAVTIQTSQPSVDKSSQASQQ